MKRAAAILRPRQKKEIKGAEGQAEASVPYREATADGIRFIKEAGADNAVLQLKSLEAFQAAANGRPTRSSSLPRISRGCGPGEVHCRGSLKDEWNRPRNKFR